VLTNETPSATDTSRSRSVETPDRAAATADLSVVILNYNTRDLLHACLTSLRAALAAGQWRDVDDESQPPAGRSCEVLVVDNASADGSADMVARDFPELRLIRSPRNGGYAFGNNLALERSRGRAVLLLNPDTELRPGALERLLEYLDAHPEAAIVGPKVLRPDGSLDLACRRSFPTLAVSTYRMLGLSRLFPSSRRFARYNLTYLDPDQPAEVDAVVGACMLVRRAAIDEVGLLDESFFMYGEDLDWALRMKTRGWKVLYFPGVSVLHHKGAASKQQSERVTVAFYEAMAIFYRKHYAARHPRLVSLLVVGAIWARCGVSLLKNRLRHPSARRVST
jgi:GT2 family glycosyltransferase